jgi:PAS domain S-box-containing protein
MNEHLSHYESLVNTAFDLFTLVDTDYRYLAVNNTYCRVQKRPREEIVGRTVAEVWGEETFQSVLKSHFDQCFAGEEVHYQRWFEFPEVGLRFFEVNYFPHWKDGKITHAIVITRDFTERKLAEKESRLLLGLTQAINESKDFHSALGIALAKICESTGWEVGEAWVPSADGTRLEYSPSFYRHLPKHGTNRLERVLAPGEGLPGKVWVGRQPIWVDEIEADPDFSRIEIARELGLKSGLAIPVRSGEEVVAVLVFFVRTPRLEDRRFMRVIDAVAGQLATLFQKKKAEDNLRKSEEQYRTVIETANDVIFRLSAAGRITALNRAFEYVTGWKREAWLGKLFTEIVHPDEVPAAWERFEGILHGQKPARWEYRVLKRSGDYLVGEITLAPYVENGQLAGIIGIGFLLPTHASPESLRSSR